MSEREILGCVDAARVPAVEEVFHRLGGDGWLTSYEGFAQRSPPSAFFRFEIVEWNGHSIHGITAELQRAFDRHWDLAVSRFG